MSLHGRDNSAINHSHGLPAAATIASKVDAISSNAVAIGAATVEQPTTNSKQHLAVSGGSLLICTGAALGTGACLVHTSHR